MYPPLFPSLARLSYSEFSFLLFSMGWEHRFFVSFDLICGMLKRTFSCTHSIQNRCKGTIFFFILQIVVCKMAYFPVFLLIFL